MFKVRFLDFPPSKGDSIDIEYYKAFFLNYDAKKWQSEVNGAVVEYIDELKEFRARCVVTHDERFGFIVNISHFLHKNYLSGWITVGNCLRLREEVDVGSDEIFFAGNFVDPSRAWRVFHAFLSNPSGEINLEFFYNFDNIPE